MANSALAQNAAPQDDAWVPSACNLCMNTCAITVHRQNGVITKIEGNPDSPVGAGTLCTKGLSGIMIEYDPNRLRAPMKRTNSEKGLGVDPKWVEISWEEALTTIGDKLKRIREDDPRKLIVGGTANSMATSLYMSLFSQAFGTPNMWFSGAGIHCGNGWHLTSNLIYQSIGRQPDVDHCDYVILFGSNWGTAAGYAFNMIAKKVAEARVRGMRLVVVDPYMSVSAEKADEWVPIRPGTDAALALGMIYVLLHELNVYDAEYIKKYTNGAYLVGPDGYYVRDEQSKKPLVWDAARSLARPYDAPDVRDCALEGKFRIDGRECTPAFHVLKDHVRVYTPEKAEQICTVPAATIRRLAREWAGAARIGSTITIAGKTLPLRPVAAHEFKGPNGHKHQLPNAMAIDLLNLLVGAQDVPGGMLGQSPRCEGFPESGRPAWKPKVGPDGLAVAGAWMLGAPHYPPHQVRAPHSLTMHEIMPLGLISPLLVSTVLEPEKYKIDCLPEMMINYGSNAVMSYANEEIMAEWYRKIPFVVGINLFLDESSDLFDIVLPDAFYLERLDPMPNLPIPMHHMSSNLSDDWSWGIRQPVVAPRFKERQSIEILLDLAERGGFLADINAVLQLFFQIGGQYRLDPESKYSWEEIADRAYKSNFGPSHGLEWFKTNGVLKWPRKVEEAYWRPFSDARVPIYFEFFKTLGAEVKRVADECGIPWDVSDYQALPDWKPCVAHRTDSGFDLYAFYYRVPFQTFSATAENPWLDEISRIDPYVYNVCLNTATAKAKGIANGDAVWLETPDGLRVKARAALTEGIHPEGAAFANCFGHWSSHLPIAKGKGACINHLQQVDESRMDLVVGGLDLCHKVRVYRAEEGQ